MADKVPEPTAEMVDFFERRTREHIARVAANLTVLVGRYEQHQDALLRRARTHDASKFGPVERIPYIWLTEYHRNRRAGKPFEYPEGIAEQVDVAIEHHLTSNRHHPNFHRSPDDMTAVDLIEMVCDWTAMAQEYEENDGSARHWADKTLREGRVRFSAENVDFIYEVIATLDQANRQARRDGGHRG